MFLEIVRKLEAVEAEEIIQKEDQLADQLTGIVHLMFPGMEFIIFQIICHVSTVLNKFLSGNHVQGDPK